MNNYQCPKLTIRREDSLYVLLNDRKLFNSNNHPSSKQILDADQ